MTLPLTTVLVLPLLAALASLLEKSVPRLAVSRPASLVAVAGAMAAAAFLSPHVFAADFPTMVVGGFPSGVGITLRLDGIALFGVGIVLTVSLSALLFSFADIRFGPLYYFFFMVMVAGMVGAILTTDIFNLFVFLEMFGIAAYILVAWSRTGHALIAGYKYLVMSSVAMAFYLVGVLLLYRVAGSFELDRIAEVVATADDRTRRLSTVAFILLAIGIGTRTAFVPYHTWLPDAHASAPHPVSAVLSGVMIKVSFLALLRLLFAASDARFGAVFLWLGAGTAVAAVVVALAQFDMKRLLAYHSISQMGYMLAALGAAAALSGKGAAAASLMHAGSHALFKSLLFLCIGMVIATSGERDLRKVVGTTAARSARLARRMPIVFACFLIGALAIAGMPPLSGYVSKKAVLYATHNVPVAYWMLQAAGVGTVASFIKLGSVFLARGSAGPSDAGDRSELTRDRYLPSPFVAVALLLLAGATLLLGVAPGRFAATVEALLAASAPTRSFAASTSASAPAISAPYTLNALAETAIVLAAGVLLTFGVRSRAGYRITALLRAPRVGLNAALVLMVAGFLVFYLVTV